MPLYSFKCSACGYVFDKRVPVGTKEAVCDRCMIGVADKEFPQAVRFKCWFEDFSGTNREMLREEGNEMSRAARQRTFAAEELRPKPHDTG